MGYAVEESERRIEGTGEKEKASYEGRRLPIRSEHGESETRSR